MHTIKTKSLTKSSPLSILHLLFPVAHTFFPPLPIITPPLLSSPLPLCSFVTFPFNFTTRSPFISLPYPNIQRQGRKEIEKMKIRCDVCDKAEASVFCSADEAALCSTCDRRVHHANKLAGKHLRFSLHHPNSSKDSPLCDICQERRAFLFCREDRAILCRECDIPIHAANELTCNHNRFLLTGVKLSAFSAQYDPTAGTTAASCSAKRGRSQQKQPPPAPAERGSPTTSYSTVDESSGARMMSCSGDTATAGSATTTSSSISEYMENLPGWQVDDFLDEAGFPVWTTPYM
ncbi:unnamed protein product [Linum tenue]|uniref:B box-type domain-containing protein n=1 Tax=Linum tenue TaxID=586396 RepID=A0AAV0GZ78_9ROSI|nr:unnamed protein product [Linum tenue]